jgi:hypothetical protein
LPELVLGEDMEFVTYMARLSNLPLKSVITDSDVIPAALRSNA